jgi:glycerol uptake facilitator-like aquaporin
LWTIKKIDTRNALLYVASQFIGAGLALMLVLSMTATIPMVASESPQIILGEAIGAFILTFGVAAVAMGKAKEDAAGLVVGGSLLVGILMASSMSSGIINPAVAFGLGSLSLSYCLGPLLGGVLGAVTFRWMSS